LLFNFAVWYAIRRVQENQDTFTLNGTYQLLVHADDVNIMGRSTYTKKRNTEVLVVVSNIIGTINAGKTKYKLMSRDENAGHNQFIIYALKGWNSSNIREKS
jgi:hypothetical protein